MPRKALVKRRTKGSKNIYAGTGISKADDAYQAGKEAVEMSIKKAGKAPDFGVVFCSGRKYGKDDRTIARLVKGAHEAFMRANPKCKWVGCTTSGEISNYGSTENTCVALTVRSDYISAGIGIANNVSKNPVISGKMAAKNALKDINIDKYFNSYLQFLAVKKKDPEFLMKFKPYTIIALAPGATMKNMGCESKLLTGLTQIVGTHIPILGGSAGDDLIFRQTYQFANGKVYKDGLIVLYMILYLNNGFAVSHGYVATDKVAFVDKSKGKLVTMMNQKNAVMAYRDLINYKLSDLMGPKIAWAGVDHPFGLVDIDGRYWIKSPQAGLKNGIVFFADIPEKSMMAVMKPNLRKSISCGKDAIREAIGGQRIGFSLVFNCTGRRTYLKKKIKQECEELKKGTRGRPFIGFYTYGEFAYDFRTPPNMVNETIVVFTAGEKIIIE